VEVQEVGLSMQERRKVIQQTYGRYQKADRVKRSLILDEFVELTGYNLASSKPPPKVRPRGKGLVIRGSPS